MSKYNGWFSPELFKLRVNEITALKSQNKFVILDELSFQISKIFGDSLKVIRDKGLHFILAHLSINDLTNVPENMDANALQVLF